MFGFGKKKKVKAIDITQVEEIEAPVYFGGTEIGRVLRVKGKEIAGLEHMEIVIRFNVGSGIDPQFQQILATQGLYIGKPV